jgi:hypothetical protein
MIYSNDLRKDLIKELADILSKLNPVEVVTPTNAQELKTRWLKNVEERCFFTNPEFNYDKELLTESASHYDRLIEIKYHLINHVKPENELEKAIFQILLNRIEQGIVTTNLAASIQLADDARSTMLIQRIYGEPSTSQIIECYNSLSDTGKHEAAQSFFAKRDFRKLSKMKFNAKEIGRWFSVALDYYGISDWDIDIDKRYTSIDARTKSSNGCVIGIPEDRSLTGPELIKLIGHEIESHIRSVENARQLFTNLLGNKSPLMPLVTILAKSDDELLDEGQAKISDVHICGTDSIPSPYYSIAIDQARRGHTFRDVAETIFGLRIEAGDSHNAAAVKSWQSTYRVFRGSTDTGSSNGYVFTKDYIYYAGYKIAKNINPAYLEFASVGLNDLLLLFKEINIDMVESIYPHKNAAKFIKNKLLQE